MNSNVFWVFFSQNEYLFCIFPLNIMLPACAEIYLVWFLCLWQFVANRMSYVFFKKKSVIKKIYS